MNRAMFFLLAILFNSVVQADSEKMKAMIEAFERMDREDFIDGIEKADECTRSRNFACAEKQLAEIKDLVNSSADKITFSIASNNLQAEKQQAAEEKRIQEEHAAQRRRAEEEQRAAEEREERRQRRLEDEESARVIGAAMMEAGQMIGQAYTDMAAGEAQVRADNAERQAFADRQFRYEQEARAAEAQRAKEERIAQQNYERNRAAASAQLAAALNESKAQSQRSAGVNAYQQAQATTAAARTSSVMLTGGMTGSTSSTVNTAAKTVTVTPSILTFTKSTGWQLNDTSQRLSAQGITVHLVVKKSTLEGKHYYQANFCDGGAGNWNGGMRVTDSYPDRTHASIRVPAGGCTSWSEHLPAGLRDVYVVVRQDVGN